MNIELLEKLSKKPKLFERSTTKFWDDEYISKKMLEAHLDPKWDAASRKHSTIDASVQWLSDEVFADQPLNILDLGCGPGLYASRLAKLGHSVTGIDISERSIEYAKKEAKRNNLNIKYIYNNYLEINYDEAFDVVLLIYCDFGALTNSERDVLLEKIYKSLKPGGLFIFDVFTNKNRSESGNNKKWDVYENGFWCENPYLELTQTFKYPENDVYLDQSIIIDSQNNISFYRNFEHIYSKKTISEVLDAFGFKSHHYFSDVTGKPYDNNSKTIALVTKK
jgi:2-polyprenyl-3-methyl-5-hydroxy-6-metoxy-1,4-benzoquinol methylase